MNTQTTNHPGPARLARLTSILAPSHLLCPKCNRTLLALSRLKPAGTPKSLMIGIACPSGCYSAFEPEITPSNTSLTCPQCNGPVRSIHSTQSHHEHALFCAHCSWTADYRTVPETLHELAHT